MICAQNVPEYTPVQQKPETPGFQLPTRNFAASDFTLKDLKGSDISLSALLGKFVFLNFRATWCPPCRAEIPSMETLHKKYKRKNFTMLAVNLRESLTTMQAFFTENNYSFPVVLDPDGEAGSGLYGVSGIPTTYFIDKDGQIIARLVRARDRLHRVSILYILGVNTRKRQETQMVDPKEHIPHREPFLFVDGVTEFDEKKIVAYRTFKDDEFFFKGHFPEYPIVPGVLLIESMAQCGGVGIGAAGLLKNMFFFLATIEKAKFRRQVRPNEKVRFEIENLRVSTRMVRQRGKAFVGEELAAEAEWLCLVADSPPE